MVRVSLLPGARGTGYGYDRMSETEIPDLTFAAAETARMTETETLDLTFAAAEARIKVAQLLSHKLSCAFELHNR